MNPRPGVELGTGGRVWVREAVWGLVLNVGAPLVMFNFLTARGVAILAALVAAAVFPASAVVWSVARTRRINVIGALAFIAIATGVVGGVILHDPHILLAKESMVTGPLGLILLGSLVVSPRPFILGLARQFIPGIGRTAIDQLEASAELRARTRLLTLIWGLVLLADASARVALTFLLPPSTVLVVGPLMAVATVGPLVLWTVRTLRGPIALARRSGV